MIYKKVLSVLLSLMLMLQPVFANNSILSQYSKRANLTVYDYLQEGLKKTNNKRDKKVIQKALRDVKRNPSLNNLKVGSALDAIFYMLLSHREKDLIRYPNLYKFYQAFKGQVRGMNLAKFNKYCVYRRDSTLSYKYFRFVDFVENKSFGCRKPKLINPRVSSYYVFAFMEKQIKINLKQIKKQQYSMSFNPLNFLIGSAYAGSIGKKIGGGVLLGVGAALGIVGVMFSISVAGIIVGIPILVAGGAAAIAGAYLLFEDPDS